MKKAIEIDFKKLFELASDRNEVEILENNLFDLYQLNRSNYDIRHLLHNTRINNQHKIELLKKVFGVNASKLFYELIFLLMSQKMIHKIYYIYEGFSKIVNEETNRIIIQLVTPLSLPMPVIQELKPKLENVFQKKVTLKNSIDPSLLGGMYLKLPNGKIFDFSYKKSLLNLKYYLMEKL